MLTVALSKNLPVSSVSISQVPAGTVASWHTAPGRQFAIAVAGALEVEVSGGVRHAVGTGQLVFLEDTQGQGHITRVQGSGVTNMFIAVPDNFDVASWASSLF
jgi:quercetin dioxygenase-like cupin family protein